MRYQDMIIESTRAAAQDAFKYAKKVASDKLEWKPLDAGRSVLELCKEMAMCPAWAEGILKGAGMPDMSEEAQAASKVEMDKLSTPEACEEECMRRLDSFFATVAAFPDEKLKDTFTLPFDGGQTITMEGNMEYPRWNFMYHQGQIAYIQTLYGDHNMYW